MARHYLPLFLALGLGACGDPTHDDAVEALGPEEPGVPAGPLHRPGQPCLVCHGGEGPSDAELSVGGTAYKYVDTLEPLVNALVKLTDRNGKTQLTGTNCAGNFFVQKTDYDPSYPFYTSVLFGGLEREMTTPVYRDGSCAGCHADPVGKESIGHIFLIDNGYPPLPGSDCL